MGLENPLHIAVLVIIVLLLFGAKRLPELGRSLGSGIREFKGSLTGEDDDDTPAPQVVQATTTQPVETAAPAATVAATPPAGDGAQTT